MVATRGVEPRTVLHGNDESAEDFSSLPSNPNQASKCYLDALRSMHVYDAVDGDWWPWDYVVAEFDFDEDGGAVGTINLSDVVLPAGTIIMDGIILTVDPVTSAGAATIAIAANAANDVLSQVTYTTPGSEGLHDIVPLGAAANMVWCSADRYVVMTIGTAALTAGHFYVFLRTFRAWVTEETSSSSSDSDSSASSSSTSSTSSASSTSSQSSSSNSSSSSSQSLSSASSASESSKSESSKSESSMSESSGSGSSPSSSSTSSASSTSSISTSSSSASSASSSSTSSASESSMSESSKSESSLSGV